MRRSPLFWLLGALPLLGILLGVTYAWRHQGARTPTDDASAALQEGQEPAPDTTQSCSTADCRCEAPYRFICGSSRPSRDPSGNVASSMGGEMLALRQLRSIVRTHPHWTSDEIEEELVRAIYTNPRRERITAVFEWTRKEIERFLMEQPESVFTQSQKADLIDRMRQVVLELPPPTAVYSDAADLFTKNEVYYERTPRNRLRLRVGGAYMLSVSSWYNMVFSLAHELGHSIDPCEVAPLGFAMQTYDKLIGCFVRNKWVDPERATCGQQEQISEVFADWLASQIVARALRKEGPDYKPNEKAAALVNAVIDLCERTGGLDRLVTSHHQTPARRIGRIFAGHPDIRRQMGCAPHRGYCQFQPVRNDP